MLANLRTENDAAVIRLMGRFDFNGHREFKQCYETAFQEPSVRRIEVDLKGVEYLDSSALGMLLLLKEHADQRDLSVSLANCTGMVKEILDVANFGVMFSMA
jgi:anti-anti-sigma factor